MAQHSFILRQLSRAHHAHHVRWTVYVQHMSPVWSTLTHQCVDAYESGAFTIFVHQACDRVSLVFTHYIIIMTRMEANHFNTRRLSSSSPCTSRPATPTTPRTQSTPPMTPPDRRIPRLRHPPSAPKKVRPREITKKTHQRSILVGELTLRPFQIRF